MGTEIETAEEIRSALQQESKKETLTLNKENEQLSQNDTEDNKEPQKKLPLKDRLDNAYSKLTDTERRAWSQGWRPEEFFVGKNRDGSERQFVSAEDFLNKSKDTLPIANERLKEMEKKLEEAERIAKEAQDRIFKAEKKGYEKALAEIEAKQQEAVELGDVDQFNKLKEDEKKLIEDQYNLNKPIEEKKKVVDDVINNPNSSNQQKPINLTPHDQQILQDWSARNSWMRTDTKLANYAIAAEKQLLNEKPHLSLQERLDLVEEEVKDIFHSKFNPTTINNPTFDSGTKNFGNPPKDKNYSSLPDSVKKQCETLIKIRGISGEDNVKRFKESFAKNIN